MLQTTEELSTCLFLFSQSFVLKDTSIRILFPTLYQNALVKVASDCRIAKSDGKFSVLTLLDLSSVLTGDHYLIFRTLSSFVEHLSFFFSVSFADISPVPLPPVLELGFASLLYAHSDGDFIPFYSFKYHVRADDSQIHISSTDLHQTDTFRCLLDMSTWLSWELQVQRVKN